jgi:YegS/Rv2252/BmrU family lipid kinase
MTHAFGPLRLIVNPHAGRGRVRENLAELRRGLDDAGVEHDAVETDAPGHAIALTRKALEEGWRYVGAVGGDGTVNEVVNGWFDGGAPVSEDAVLAVAAAGSGSDFVRTFGLPRRPDLLARHLATDRTAPVDVGRLTYRDGADAGTTRLFANVAEVGWGAEVVRRANRAPRWLGRARYLVAAYGAIAATRRPETTVELGHTTLTRPLVNLVVANGQFFGGGMKVAPRGIPDDDRFNVQLFWGGRSQVFVLTTRIYRGEHLPHPNIAEHQSATVAVEADEPLPIEADGEYLGTTPARFSLLPQALRLKL